MSNNKQTPKEKAAELFNSFCNIEDIGRFSDEHGFSCFSTEVMKKQAQQCVLILIDEILKNFGTLTEGKQHYAAYCTIKFYEQVKHEIENL